MSIGAGRVTRLGISGSVWRPAGDFSGKIPTPPTPPSTGPVTRFGIGGDIWRRAGDFSGKTPFILDESVTKGGDSTSREKERKLKLDNLRRVEDSKEELARLVPTEAVQILATTGKVEINGIEFQAPRIPAPKIPEHMLPSLKGETKLEVLTKVVKQQRLQAEKDYEVALKVHQEDLRMFEEEFITFLMLVLL
jgi:hypothetical protein